MNKKYRVRPFIRPLLWALLFGHSLIYVGMPLVFLTGGTSESAAVSFGRLLPIALIMLPTLLFVLYFLYQNYGTTILTDDGIVWRKFLSEKRIGYSDVLSIKEKDFNFPKNLVVKAKNKTIRISHNSENFSEIHDRLLKNIAAFQISVEVAWPWVLEARLFVFRKWLNITGIPLLWGFMLGIVYSQLPPVSGERNRGVALFFILLWAFLSGLCIALHLKEEAGKNRPIMYRFEPTGICFQMPGKKAESVSIDKIRKIDLVRHMRMGSAPGEGIEVAFPYYTVGIMLAGKHSLVIDDRRAKQFGLPVLRIYHTLVKLYPGLR